MTATTLATRPGTGPGPHFNQAVEDLALDRFVDSFLDQSNRSQVRLALTSVMIAVLWAGGQGLFWPCLWYAAVLAMTWWRHAHTAGFVRQGDPERRAQRVAQLLLASGLLQAAPTMAFGAFSDFGRAVLTMTLLVVATVSVITTSGFRSVFMAFAAPLVTAPALGWAWYGWAQQDATPVLLSLAILLYLSFLFGSAKHASKVFFEGCAYRLGEQQLNVELKQALGVADEANRAKTQFLAAASHDLRQPIHSMNVLVAALSLRPLDAQTRDIVNLLGSVNQVLSRQLDTLLDVSKLDAGVIRAEPAALRLDLLASAHHGVLSPVAAQRGLLLELDLSPELWVYTDAALLTRALSNLTDNAIKYTPYGGRVRLSVKVNGTDAVLTVEDSGIGIAPDEQERVFREFYQVSNVERDRSKGLGLGLSIVRRLCALLNVRIDLQSRLGEGTVISLHLPLASAGTAAEPEVSLAQAPRGLRVLVVDDEEMVRASTQLLLLGLGCQVHLAESSEDAQALAQTTRLDVMLSDLRLRADDSGLQAIEAVRRHQPDVRAVLITGDTAPERIREAEAAGVPLLFKPVTLPELVKVLAPAPASPV